MYRQQDKGLSYVGSQQPPDEHEEWSEELKARAERVEQLAKNVSFGDSDETIVKKVLIAPEFAPETRIVDPVPASPAHITPDTRVELRFEFEVVGFPPARIEIDEDLIVGRASQDGKFRPDLDLAPFGGVTHGVSRQHLKILKSFNTVHVMDMGSTNGSYLNDQMLFIGQPRVLHNGDLLRLGTLAMNVFIERIE